jgi:hypothetical protein
MSDKVKPTAGAIRAAEILAVRPSKSNRLVTLKTAEIIDRETAVPEILDALETLTEYLEESHEDEIANEHYGDGSEGCSYCEAIANAKDIIRKANGL